MRNPSCVGQPTPKPANNMNPVILSSRQTQKVLWSGALLLAIATPVFAQEKPFAQGGTGQIPPAPTPAAPPAAESAGSTNAAACTNPMGQLFGLQIPGAIANGKINLNVRARYEQDDIDNQSPYKKNSYAPTVRTRFGFTTAPLYGFQGMLEGVNISDIGPEHNYNAAGVNSQAARPPVADPPMTRMDQAWFGYSYTNYFSAKVGQQQIDLDNQRFIGDAGWRQNMQTYDAIGVQSSPIKDLNLYYGYVWKVNRVYGDVPGLSSANADFDSRSHLINISYSGWDYGRFTGYAYLLDLSNSNGASGNLNSCATYGGSFAGAAPASDWMTVDYRAEFAWQNQYADSPLRYSASYYNLEAGANVKPLAFGAGYEYLGSGANSGAGGGRVGFKTPLVSPHPFNGWAETFVNHPANGLRDLYGFVQVTLPWQIPVRAVYHKFDAAFDSGNYGQEIDLVGSRKFAKNWSVLVEYADYLGEDAAPPVLATREITVQKFWAAVEFIF